MSPPSSWDGWPPPGTPQVGGSVDPDDDIEVLFPYRDTARSSPAGKRPSPQPRRSPATREPVPVAGPAPEHIRATIGAHPQPYPAESPPHRLGAGSAVVFGLLCAALTAGVRLGAESHFAWMWHPPLAVVLVGAGIVGALCGMGLRAAPSPWTAAAAVSFCVCLALAEVAGPAVGLVVVGALVVAERQREQRR